MKKLKTFESYLSDKMKLVKDKFNKLKKIIDFINKYKMEHFVIATETSNGDYLFEEISKKDNSYYLMYEDHTNGVGYKTTEITELSNKVVDELLSVCENEQRFTVEFHLESFGSIDVWYNILKKHKKPINFSEWMFSMLLENDLQKDANSYKFQNILFSTHPEAFNTFMNESIDSKKRSIGKSWEPLKVAPGIVKKYKSLFDDYQIYIDSKKYNI